MHIGMFQAEEFGDLQRLVDGLFTGRETIDRLDLIVQAEILDLTPDLLEIVNLVPPGTYNRTRLCDQINSALAAHGWGATYGTVEYAPRTKHEVSMRDLNLGTVPKLRFRGPLSFCTPRS